MDQDRAKEIRRKLQSARQQGLLDPLFGHLEERAENLTAPFEPEDSSWPLKRAFRDGGQEELNKLYTWLDGRSKPSPDGA